MISIEQIKQVKRDYVIYELDSEVDLTDEEGFGQINFEFSDQLYITYIKDLGDASYYYSTCVDIDDFMKDTIDENLKLINNIKFYSYEI